MGGALGRLHITDYNLTKHQMVKHMIPVDFTYLSADIQKQNKSLINMGETEFPLLKILDLTGWSDSDKIIRILYIPFVIQRPIGYSNQDVVVDTSNMSFLPVNSGHGQDRMAEEQFDKDPGSFKVSGIEYRVRDFDCFDDHGWQNYGTLIDLILEKTRNMSGEELVDYVDNGCKPPTGI